MATTYTLTKVEPFITPNDASLSGSGTSVQGKQYKYICVDNSNPAKTITIISPDANLLTPGNNGLSGTNTGSIVITDTPG